MARPARPSRLRRAATTWTRPTTPAARNRTCSSCCALAGRPAAPLIQRPCVAPRCGRPLGTDLLADAAAVARGKARLAHLCRLIVRDRTPYCGANGILLVVPLAGTDTPAEAQLTAQAVQEDLAVARRELKLDCPLVALLADLEQVPGCVELLQRLPAVELGTGAAAAFRC